MLSARGRAALRRVVLGAALLLAAAIAGGGSYMHTAATQWNRSAPVSRVACGNGMVALTFDSGWGEDYTRQVLDALAQRNLRATFFLTGYWMDEHADKARAIAAAGHELGGHSVTHSRMAGMDAGAADGEITGVSERIETLTGAPPRCFRPPYGDWDAELLMRVQRQGQVTVTWSLDAQARYGEGGLSAALAGAQPGDIVLMSLCDAALERELGVALDGLLARGLTLTTVSALLDAGAPARHT